MKSLLTALSACVVVYLLASFYSVSFNIAKWSEGARGTCVTWMVFGGLAAGVFRRIECGD